MEYFNPEKLLTLEGIYAWSIIPMEMEPRKLEYFIFSPTNKFFKQIWPFTKRKRNEFIFNTLHFDNLGHSKKTLT